MDYMKIINDISDLINRHDYILLLSSNSTKESILIENSFLTKTAGQNIKVLKCDSDCLALYSLFEFTDKLIIGSFISPSGRKLLNLLDSGVATEDDLINDVILGGINCKL
jgi:hypothetical protein